MLSSEYSVEEVKAALFQMGPTKTPRYDGMNALFYQKFGQIVRDDVTAAVLDFLNSGNMLPKINYIHIVLIPKIKSLERISDYRPINLCNVIYKFISKVLANRLKLIFLMVISPTQIAFFPSRFITDNTLVAYETLHTMHGRRSGRWGSLALKLDISKAYDHVEWPFLKGIMSRLGLPKSRIDKVMTCVTSLTFSICIHGKSYGNVRPSREIRQGDPLLPYLFLLCAKGFSSLLAKAEEDRWIHGVAICKRAPNISHLLFADD